MTDQPHDDDVTRYASEVLGVSVEMRRAGFQRLLRRNELRFVATYELTDPRPATFSVTAVYSNASEKAAADLQRLLDPMRIGFSVVPAAKDDTDTPKKQDAITNRPPVEPVLFELRSPAELDGSLDWVAVIDPITAPIAGSTAPHEYVAVGARFRRVTVSVAAGVANVTTYDTQRVVAPKRSAVRNTHSVKVDGPLVRAAATRRPRPRPLEEPRCRDGAWVQ